jgi:hypothetical protein
MTAFDQRTVRYFYEAIAAWSLDDTAAGILIGVSPRAVDDWKIGQVTETSEEVLARMMMVVQIRTALDICWSTSLANEWISLPNTGDPYQGLSPVAYVAEHGWSGLYYILRQVQARAVGN